MGCYVNPPDESKEEFLQREGRGIRVDEAEITADEVPVCLVDNGMFRAAAVAYSHGELRAFGDVTDMRPKAWFMVSREKLRDVSDLSEYE